jgi:hypothetical protein
MSGRPTPETDALRKSIDNGADAEAEMTLFAGKLERERDEAREKITRQAERIRELEGATNHAGGLHK